ncbi:MAG: ABC transporter permease, partial [Candidatus Angelobacter sp.]
MARSLAFAFLRLLALMLIASLAGASLVRIAPGFSSDEQELNSGLSSESIQALRQARMADANIPRFYGHYLASLLHGDLGVSRTLNLPVRELLRERLPVTLENLGAALVLGWLLGLALAVAGHISRSRMLLLAGDGLGGTLISTPAAVMALIFVILRWPPVLA